jgi:hypothetical protein
VFCLGATHSGTAGRQIRNPNSKSERSQNPQEQWVCFARRAVARAPRSLPKHFFAQDLFAFLQPRGGSGGLADDAGYLFSKNSDCLVGD